MSGLKLALKIFTAVTGSVVLVLSVYLFFAHNIFRIRDIDIQLADRAAASFIYPKIKEGLDLRFRNLFGQSIWRADLKKILRTVENDPRVKEVKVQRVLPSTIRIIVSPYTPILNIMGKHANELHPIARDGEVLPAVPGLEAPDSPILRGESFLKDQNMRLRAIALLLSLPESGSLSQRSVSEIFFDKKKGFQLRLQPSGLMVWIGFEDFVHRAHQAKRVLEYLENERLAGRIIDARYSKKVVVKLRNDP